MANPVSEPQVHDKYVKRLRARLAKPSISVADARDGILDCYVSTYHAGVQNGLKGILGVDASPDQVAQVATKMFRDRLADQGESFDAPSIDALHVVKAKLDKEFHFEELPVEVSATHDQVCSLLVAKADGLMEHRGDQSVLRNSQEGPAAHVKPKLAVPPKGRARGPAPLPKAVRKGGTSFAPAVPAPAKRSPRAERAEPAEPSPTTTVSASLREGLRTYLAQIAGDLSHVPSGELLNRLDKARTLAQSIAQFDD